MPLTATLAASVIADQSAAIDLGTVSFPLRKYVSIALANGTGANQADRLWTDTRTVAGSGTDALDLAGSLVDAFGTTVTFVKLKGVLISAAAGNTNNVRVNRPAANGVPLFLAASDGIDVLPGGVFVWVAPGVGVTVTAATADLLNVDNSSSGTSVTYDIVLVGTSA
jgi:hypothetical protein